MTTKQPIFFSSCFEDPKDVSLGIRKRVADITGGFFDEPQYESDRLIWLAEDFKQIDKNSTLGNFEQTEFCLGGVRNAECFVAVITERHGTQIALDGLGEVATSFFEAELFEAALLRKPSFIFLHNDYEPDKKMANLLKLLKPAFPNMYLTPRSEDEIVSEIDSLLKHFQQPRWKRRFLPLPDLGSVVDKQFAFRHRPYDPKNSLPPLRFLNIHLGPKIPRPDKSHIEAILERAAAEELHQTRLTLIWFAIRTLMGAPFNKPAYSDFLPLWERALHMWASNSAWYGLHGHFPMSCLAAIGSLSQIRKSFADKSEPRHGIPHGSLASEYYSIAKLAGHSSSENLDLALEHIQIGIDSNDGDIAGQKAVRASIYLQTGRSDDALADYQCVAELRKDQGNQAYGEALSEWGYAKLRTGEKVRGVTQMEEGLELLKSAPPSGFQIRAMRKLAVGYAQCWKIGDSLDLAVEAHDLALSIGAHDQIHSLQRLAKKLKVQF